MLSLGVINAACGGNERLVRGGKKALGRSQHMADDGTVISHSSCAKVEGC
jgi:hypothetical protein